MSITKRFSIRLTVLTIIHIYLKMYDTTFFGLVGDFGFRDIFYYFFTIGFGYIAWDITERLNLWMLKSHENKKFAKQLGVFALVHLCLGIIWGALFATLYYYSTLVIFGFKVFENFFITDLELAFALLIFYAVVNSIAGIKLFYGHWKNEVVRNERLEKEYAQSKYEALKNQIDPHFFFNSLSVLSNLVYKDQDMAADFIGKLSKLYRYILDIRERKLVSLKEELSFVQNYYYLMKIRHGDQIILNVSDLDEEESYIPPITLQLLVENAVKHNIYSEEEPLLIKIYKQSGFLIVKNSIQKRKLLNPGSGLGLSNIKSRYALIAGKEVNIIETDKEFIVSLPIIRSAEIENSNF